MEEKEESLKKKKKKSVINRKGKMLKKKGNVKDEEIENEFVDEILKKKRKKVKVRYSGNLIEKINCHIFKRSCLSKFLLFTLHYVPMKVLFDLKEGMVWILT